MLAYIGALFAAFSAGVVIVLQAPVNAKLGQIIGGPVAASLITFVVGLSALIVVAALMKQLPQAESFARTSPWMWTGGLLGAYIVVVSVYAVPVTGTTLLFALIVAGQMIGALLADHYGFLLPEAHAITLPRLAGVVCLAAGVYLIQKY